MTVIIRLVLAVAIVTASMTSSASAADPWPQRTVRLIAPISAGTATDLAARLFAERLSKRWGQPVVVENRPGGRRHRRRQRLPLRHRPPRASVLVCRPGLDQPVALRQAALRSRAGHRAGRVGHRQFFRHRRGQLPRCRHDRRLHRDGAAPAGQAELGRDTGPAAVHLRRLPEAGGRGTSSRCPTRKSRRCFRISGRGVSTSPSPVPSPLLPLVKSGKARMSMVTNRERSPLAPQVPTAAEAGLPGSDVRRRRRLLRLARYAGRASPAHRGRRRMPRPPTQGSSNGYALAGSWSRTGTTADFVAAIEDQKAKIRALAPAKNR